MNKQQFDMDIQAADNNSLRIGAANRIVQLLQKLRYSNNENSAKRWIWELCQNAKDVCNSTGKVKISINYDETDIIIEHENTTTRMSLGEDAEDEKYPRHMYSFIMDILDYEESDNIVVAADEA